MPLDSVFLTALAGELAPAIVGARIDRVSQPGRDTVVLALHGPRGDGKLLLCVGTGSARVQLTEERMENPAAPPMFCMLLRKHLVGARITGLTQPPWERLVILELDATDALGCPVKRRLAAELMGRYANLILTDGDGIILDCLRRVDSEMSDKRLVLPGLLYRLPPAPDRLAPDAVTPEELARRLGDAGEAPLDRWLSRTLEGLSPLCCRELAVRAYGDGDVSGDAALRRDGGAALLRELAALCALKTEGGFVPTLLLEEDTPADFTFRPVVQYGSARRVETRESFSALLDEYFARRDARERMRQRASSLLRVAKTARDRTARRLAAQKQELAAAADRDDKRICGDILTANLWRMEKGMRSLTAEDFYAQGSPQRVIPLDPLKTPQQNAAKYYREYTKARTAGRILTERVAEGERELDYLESVLDELNRAESERDLGDIRQELIANGYEKLRKGERQKPTGSAPLRFRSTAGFEIRVGRNNAQNDRLTLKDSGKNDLWLHVQKLHGSHAVISLAGAEPDPQTVLEAAALAALHSQARDGGTVPVDVTLVRHVKKPAGARPGMVIYTDYRTVFVKPDPALADRLRVK